MVTKLICLLSIFYNLTQGSKLFIRDDQGLILERPSNAKYWIHDLAMEVAKVRNINDQLYEIFFIDTKTGEEIHDQGYHKGLSLDLIGKHHLEYEYNVKTKIKDVIEINVQMNPHHERLIQFYNFDPSRHTVHDLTHTVRQKFLSIFMLESDSKFDVIMVSEKGLIVDPSSLIIEAPNELKLKLENIDVLVDSMKDNKEQKDKMFEEWFAHRIKTFCFGNNYVEGQTAIIMLS